MRTAKIHLDGEDRLLCFSTRVMENVCDKYGGLEGFFAVLQGSSKNTMSMDQLRQQLQQNIKDGDSEAFDVTFGLLTQKIQDNLMAKKQGNQLSAVIWAMEQMMAAGARYAKRKGISAAEPLSADDIRDVCDLSDFADLQKSVLETITSGNAREVEAEPPKNAETTPIGTAAP